MNSLKNTLLLLVLIVSFQASSQFAGNQTYGGNYNYNKQSGKRTIYSNDSTLSITTQILLNKRADKFRMSVGANQEALTAIECNDILNDRINKLKKSLSSLDINEDNIYVDFISQTKIYDHEVEGNESEQVEVGYETKKNIIIEFDDVDMVDLIIELCAKQDIFDIIKMDYINEDVYQTYEKMFAEGLKIIESRKDIFLSTSNLKLNGEQRILQDDFYSLYPKSQYKKYEAFESSHLQVYNREYSQSFVQKESRKSKTAYYEGIELSGFDKIINHSNPEVGIQYILSITMIYYLE